MRLPPLARQAMVSENPAPEASLCKTDMSVHPAADSTSTSTSTSDSNSESGAWRAQGAPIASLVAVVGLMAAFFI